MKSANDTKKRRLCFPLVSLALAGLLVLGNTGVAFADVQVVEGSFFNRPASEEPIVVLSPEMEAVLAGDPAIAILKELGRDTTYYENRLKKIWDYKQALTADGCQEINLQACAEVCYAIDESDGFSDGRFIHKEKTILRNYITKNQVFEFGITGEIPEGANFQIVYFKDENGNKTNEPAIFYVANPENKVFDVSVVQGAIDWWEERAPEFLEALVDNNVRILFQSQGGDNERVQITYFDDGIIYKNYSGNSSSGFEAGLINSLPVEALGVCCDAVGMTSNEQGLVKSRLFLSCLNFIAINNKESKILGFIDGNKQESVLYTEWYSDGRNEEQIVALVEDAKKVTTPFGAETWEEIDAALGNQ